MVRVAFSLRKLLRLRRPEVLRRNGPGCGVDGAGDDQGGTGEAGRAETSSHSVCNLGVAVTRKRLEHMQDRTQDSERLRSLA